MTLYDNHGVSKGEETIFLLHCSLIGMHDVLLACQCRHQHYKCGFRQVEVCDQGIDHFEMIARIDKYLCPSASGFQNSIFSCCRFQCSAACGSYRYYTFTCLLCIVDQLCLIFLYYIWWLSTSSTLTGRKVPRPT